jgi:phospholipid transport system transporter-binding protein
MMFDRNGDRLVVRSAMTFSQAVALREAVLGALDRDGLTIDLGQVQESDSTALSLLLEWQRAAKARGWTVRHANLPANLRSLAEVYGVLELLALADPDTAPPAA